MQFQASADNFVLLLLQSRLGLLEGRLQLVLLHLKSPPLPVQLMDGLAALTQLVKQVLDLICQVLVLSADGLEILNALIPCSLDNITTVLKITKE